MSSRCPHPPWSTHEPKHHPYPRGRFATAIAGTVAAAIVLAGCGGAGNGPTGGDGASGDVDPDAIIEAGISYALSGSFDPMVASGAVTVSANWHIFRGSELGTLVAGESAELESETIVLTAQDVAAGSVAAPSVEATASNGERDAEASVAAAIVTLPAAGEWKSNAVYVAGDRVSYDGGLWEASWWTSAQRPGDPYGPWQEIAVDADGRTVWNASRIFDTGDVVVYNGTEYTAKWWTRNQQPGLANGPWK